MKTLSFTIDGAPVAKARPRFTKTGAAYTQKKTKDAETAVCLAFVRRFGLPDKTPSLPVALEVTAFMPIPKGTSKKKKALMDGQKIPHTKRPDFDNLAKLVCDALNGVAWEDDGCIWSACVKKVYSISPRIEVTINYLEESDFF